MVDTAQSIQQRGGARSAQPAPLWQSLATQHLCTAAYIDRRFRRDTLNEVYFRPGRAVAPSYGFDLAPVLFHCRVGWIMETIRDVAVVIVSLIAFKASPLVYAALIFVAVTLFVLRQAVLLGRDALRIVLADERSLAALAIRCVWFVVLYVALGLVLPFFLIGIAYGGSGLGTSSSTDGSSFPEQPGVPTQSTPFSDIDWTNWIAIGMTMVLVVLAVAHRLGHQFSFERIAAQNADWQSSLGPRITEIARKQFGNITQYAGFLPFIGSGALVRDWSFAQRLMPKGSPQVSSLNDALSMIGAKTPETMRLTGADVEEFPTPFDAVAIVDHLHRRLDQMRTNEHLTQRLGTLTVTEHAFLSGHYRSPFEGDRPTPVERAAILREPDGPARQHLMCQVSTWGGEVVVTMYVLVSVQGGMLHVEFSVLVLPPTKPEYHIVDRVGGVGPAGWLRAVWKGLVSFPSTVLFAPLRIAVSIRDLVCGAMAQAGKNERGPWVDQGARVSVRELAAAPIENYYQFSDALKFAKLVERRVLADIVEYLDQQGVDVSDLVERATNILNNTVINNNNGAQNFGSGNINANNSTMGTNNTSTRGEPAG